MYSFFSLPCSQDKFIGEGKTRRKIGFEQRAQVDYLRFEIIWKNRSSRMYYYYVFIAVVVPSSRLSRSEYLHSRMLRSIWSLTLCYIDLPILVMSAKWVWHGQRAWIIFSSDFPSFKEITTFFPNYPRSCYISSHYSESVRLFK